MICPVCKSEKTDKFHEDKRREYYRCEICKLVFVPEKYFVPLDIERAEYDLHENSLDDEGYRKFLSRVFEPVAEMLKPKSVGLDFGCGSAPLLARMFEEMGHSVTPYDPYYFPGSHVLDNKYDFITATEVFEHLHKPWRTVESLWGMLRNCGVIGVMTKLVKDREAFANWHYKNDKTHVTFFSKETFLWLAEKLGASVEFVGDDVILLKKL